jgi:trk system potassium uptake protein TrkA
MKAKQFLVIGAGRFGSAVATTLYELGHEVVVVDRAEEPIEEIINRVTHAAIMDATDEEALRTLGVNNFDEVVVAIGNDFEANILATVAVRGLEAKHVYSKANSLLEAKVLSQVGADEVVRPEHDMGVRLAKQVATPSLVDAFNLGESYGVVEMEAKKKLCGKLSELRLTNRFGVQVIAINRGDQVVITPRADAEIMRGDKVVLIGSNESVERFQQYLAE